MKKNLEGYIPIQQRAGLSARPPPKPKSGSKRGGAPVAKGISKPRRTLVKT